MREPDILTKSNLYRKCGAASSIEKADANMDRRAKNIGRGRKNQRTRSLKRLNHVRKCKRKEA